VLCYNFAQPYDRYSGFRAGSCQCYSTYTARHIVPEVERVGGQVWSGGPFGQRADGVTVRVGMAEEYLVTEH